MFAWFGILCQLLPIARLIANGAGWHLDDSFYDGLSQIFCGVAGAGGTVVQAKAEPVSK